MPPGIWSIYNTRKACCETNFAYSTLCMATHSEQPTKHPTIAAPEGDDFEIVPIKFDVGGLPCEVDMRELKEEMRTVLKRILLRLADRIEGLKISNVEEKVVLSRHMLRALQNQADCFVGVGKKDVELYFNVYVVRDDDREFGPLIISEIRDSYELVLEQVQ